MIIDVNPIVSGWNYDIKFSIIAQLLMSWPFDDLAESIIQKQVWFDSEHRGAVEEFAVEEFAVEEFAVEEFAVEEF